LTTNRFSERIAFDMETTNEMLSNRKVYKDGCRVAYTEFEVRPLDEHGDCVDVEHYDTKKEAIAVAHEHMRKGALAVVVEKHVSRHPAHLFKEADSYKLLLALGDPAILQEGDWNEQD